jgi:hypothetical protein
MREGLGWLDRLKRFDGWRRLCQALRNFFSAAKGIEVFRQLFRCSFFYFCDVFAFTTPNYILE